MLASLRQDGTLSLRGDPRPVSAAVFSGIKVGNSRMGCDSVIPQHDRTGFPYGSEMEVDTLGNVIASELSIGEIRIPSLLNSQKQIQ
jgi:hypothetical protein